MPRHQAGFTLIEAVIGLAIVAFVLGIAIPSWTSATAAAHSGGARTSLYDTVIVAGSHATATGSSVVLCPSEDGAQCNRSTDWSQGWIAFADLDGDRERSPIETLLRQQGPLSGKTHLRSTSGRTRLVFQPFGGMPGSNVTFTLCDQRGPAQATTVVLSNSARIRQGKPTDEAAFNCVYGS